MYRTFNMGIGMTLVFCPKDIPAVNSYLRRKRIRCFKIGNVINDKKRRIVI